LQDKAETIKLKQQTVYNFVRTGREVCCQTGLSIYVGGVEKVIMNKEALIIYEEDFFVR